MTEMSVVKSTITPQTGDFDNSVTSQIQNLSGEFPHCVIEVSTDLEAEK